MVKKEKDYILVLTLLAIVGVFILTRQGGTLNVLLKHTTPTYSPWLEKYSTDMAAAGISNTYLAESTLEDYSNPEIQKIITDIASKSIDAEDATQKVLDYVYFNMDYVYDEPDGICYSSSASNILQRGTYNCDTGSRLVRTMLRGLGIATAPVSGCLGISKSCGITLAISGIDVPQFKQLTDEDVAKGVVSRNGGLHAYNQVWLPGKGWKIIEATAGRFADDLLCVNYLQEYIPADVVQECVSSDPVFIQTCKQF